MVFMLKPNNDLDRATLIKQRDDLREALIDALIVIRENTGERGAGWYVQAAKALQAVGYDDHGNTPPDPENLYTEDGPVEDLEEGEEQ